MLTDLLLILIWLIVVIISFWLFKLSAGTMSIMKPNLLSITFYYSLLVSSYIGPLLIVLEKDKHYMINELQNADKYRITGFIILSIIMILLPLSMFIVKQLAGFNAKVEVQNYVFAKINDENHLDKYYFIMYGGLTFISVSAVAYTIIHLETIPILALLTGGNGLDALRIEASHGFTGNPIIRNVLALNLTPILSMITFIYAHKTSKLKWKILFSITFVCAVFMQIYTLAKGPIFFYLIMFIVLMIYMGILKLNWFKIGMAGILAVVGLVIMYVFIQGVTDVSQYFSYNTGPIGRLILSQIAPFYLHLEVFPLDPHIVIEQSRSAAVVAKVIFEERVNAGTLGVLNTLFAGEAYAMFRYPGIIIGTIYIGVFIQLIYIIFTRLPKNPLFLALFVYFSVNIPRVVIGGFTDFLLNTLWIGLLIILLAPYVLLQLHRVYKKIKEDAKVKETVS